MTKSNGFIYKKCFYEWISIKYLSNGLAYHRDKTRDPLSLYLFLICYEGLSTLLNILEEQNEFQGLKLNRHWPRRNSYFLLMTPLCFVQLKIKIHVV